MLMLIGRRGQIQFIDPFDNKKGNFNVAVAAASGAGKSFFTQEMVTSLLATGGRCWVIDSGRSYERLCGMVGGTYLEFSDDTHINLNPFSRVQDISEEMPMLKAVADIARRTGTPCQVSLEAYMACGMGACLGCVVKGKDHTDETPDYRCVCKDGPVFAFDQLMWV